MVKFLHLLPTAALALAMGWTSAAQAETFEIEENFDNSASFSQGGELPDGWTQAAPANFLHRTGSYYGLTPHSGDYVLGMSTGQPGGVLYSAPVKLAAGGEAAIEFQAYMPGGTSAYYNLGLTVFAGTSADIASMKEIGKREAGAGSAWEKLVYTFTPETDGEYYYAIRIDAGQLTPGGTVLLDTFFFSGNAPEEINEGDPPSTYAGMELLEPDPENLSLCQELPYFENFSDPSHYDGLSVLPKGWSNTGSNIWRTASTDDLPAASGDWYMITDESGLDRDERAYTPFFNLQKGVTYTLTFSSYQQSTLYDEDNNIRRITTIDVKVGTQHDAEFIPVRMLEIEQDNPAGRWIEHSVTFCPAESGPYCFCFQLHGLPWSGLAAIDDIRITSPVDLARPEPGFAPMGIFNLMNSSLLSMDQDPVRFINISNYAEEYEWDTHGAQFNQLPNGDIDVFMPSSNLYTIELTATNARGSRSTSRSFNVEHVAEESSQMALMGYDPELSNMYTRMTLPKFPTDPEFDFVSGYNHYYRTYAEYYQLPPSAEFNITNISVWLSWLNYRSLTTSSDDQRIKPFNVKIYGADENGKLDESKYFGGVETTMDKVFGGSGTNELNARDVTFPEPVHCQGPIYIVFEYSEEMDMHPTDPNFTRSYIALNMLRHNHGRTTMYVKPYAVPEDSNAKVGEWCPVTDIDKSLKGLGLAFQLWAAYKPGESSVAVNNVGETLFAARYADGNIQVSGTVEGEWLAVYDLAGKCVAMAQASNNATVIEASELPAGLYIVRGNNGSARFLK